MFASLSRAMAAKTMEKGIAHNENSPTLSYIHQRLSLDGVGLKCLTRAAPTSGEAQFATAKTSVWWDVENCSVPKGIDGHKIALNIRSVLMKMNYHGPLSISAYGDTNQITTSIQQALSSTGVSLNHVPPGVKDGSDKKIVVDMLLWAYENRAPANIMLISGDGDFSYVLHQLGMKGYNIILVRPENKTSPFLIASAKTILLWRSIATTGSASEVPKLADPSKRSVVAIQAEPSKRCKVVAVSAPKVPKQTEQSKKSQRCEICNVSCSSLVDFNSHISGKKHKNKEAVVASQSAQFQPKTMWCSKIQYPTAGKERRHKNKLKTHA